MNKSTQLSLHFIEQKIIALETFSGTDAILATEGFALFRQIENVLFRVINNFKLNITRGFKDFKRSELRMYKESYRGDVREIFNKKWNLVNHLLIPVSRAMHRPYAISSEHVKELLEESVYPAALEHMSQALMNMKNVQNMTDVKAIKATTNSLHNLWGTQGYVPDKDRLLPYMDLSGRGTIELHITDVFSSMEDVEKTFDIVLEYEKYFTEIINSKSTLDVLEKTVDSLISSLEHQENLSKDYISNFHELVSTFSTFLDAYSLYLQAAQVIEHCFVLDLKELIRN